ncbi:putative oxidoreductase C-terminal domain-containing protein [Parabacteroides gordonii]|jgi:predicted dehydrogenase|uniref:putative oxidoreductase C-terminal domain-containing protein n=1 Tax=Parabacteroides gordonii TaxID=574930 RepID=UPI00241BFA28|nr:putative oxidoreductase C-terminal domain-containing protein [Parabacteroides gordonii]
MKNYLVFTMTALLLGTSCSSKKEQTEGFTGAQGEVKLITLDPGHFHAALVQKVSYPQVCKDVYVYAPGGFDADEHLKRIEGFNTRAENPTGWNEIVYTGSDYLEKMLAEKKGNVMVQAGNNGKKTEYIKKTLEAGINVLSDKPMAINSHNFQLLEECFDIAKQKNILLYDIMTERNEITTMLQRELSTIPAIYGEQLKGSPDEPAIVKESVHHLFKLVDNKPLTRPVWYFDVTQQGEGIVDVTTHLVDLVQWEAFPEQIIDYKKDIELVDANRWTTSISPEEFKQVTGTDAYPDFLKKDVENDTLKVYCNGDIVYKIKGVTAKVSVIWNYTFPKGGGDTHFSVMKGSKADLVIRQGQEQGYKPELYIEALPDIDLAAYEKELATAMSAVVDKYPGVALNKIADNVWQVQIPVKYRVGHEAHFGQVMENYLQYLQSGKLPDWEVPNMIAKYYVTSHALEMAKSK